MDKMVKAASGILSSIKKEEGSADCSVSRSNLSTIRHLALGGVSA
jgi:hypothetical protein